jgi:hypothetical protein
MKDVYELLMANSLIAYLLVASSMIVAISRGGFALQAARNRSRREFMELWCNGDKSDDFWLEMAIRHSFGGYLPAKVIRKVINLTFPALKLMKVSGSWPYLKYDDETGLISWKKQWRSRTIFKWVERIAFSIGYVIFASVAMYFFKLDGSLAAYAFIAYFLLVSALCLFKVIDLFSAESVIRLVRS